MDLKNIGIKHTYYSFKNNGSFKFKNEIQDFVVQEKTLSGFCCIKPIIDYEKFSASEEVIAQLISNEEISKVDRKLIYEKSCYYPFKKLKTVNNKIQISDDLNEIYTCIMMKFDLNTIDAIQIIAKRLGIPKHFIQFSGNKDRKGITFQEVSINCNFQSLFNYAVSLSKNNQFNLEIYGYRKEFEEINEQVINAFKKFIKIEEFESNDRIKLFDIKKGNSKKMGDHLGNLFTIKIQNLHGIKDVPKYFLNYYGHQRFGKSMNNHIIGKFILEQNFDGAIDLILKNKPEFNQNRNNISQEHETFGYNSTQKYILRMKEKKCSSKYIINQIDRSTIMMYMHAYQSYIFNNSVNNRWETKLPQKSDKIMRDGLFEDADKDCKLEDLYLALEEADNKFMKGTNRKMIEEIFDFECLEAKDGIILKFFLNKSTYATSALREIIGDSVYHISD